jgi:hypothetical protein
MEKDQAYNVSDKVVSVSKLAMNCDRHSPESNILAHFF